MKLSRDRSLKYLLFSLRFLLRALLLVDNTVDFIKTSRKELVIFILYSYIEAYSTNQSEVCLIELLLALGPY